MKKIVDCETGEEIKIELSMEEIEQQKIDEDRTLALIEAKEAEEAAKIASRQALLDKLGITADEAKLLLS